jgi:hypothetical protein
MLSGYNVGGFFLLRKINVWHRLGLFTLSDDGHGPTASVAVAIHVILILFPGFVVTSNSKCRVVY